MSGITIRPDELRDDRREAVRENYLNVKHTVASWLLTGDHKRIAALYLVSISVLFAVGGATAAGIRLALTSYHDQIFASETYNKLFTIHGVIMVFFFLVPSIP